MFQVYLPPKSTHEETRLNMLVHYRDMYRHLADWTAENPLQLEVARAGRRAMILYGELAADSYAAGDGLALLFWRPTPKFHMFQELAEYQCARGTFAKNLRSIPSGCRPIAIRIMLR